MAFGRYTVSVLYRLARVGLWISCAWLTLAGLLKLVSAPGSARILFEHDPIFLLTNQQLFVMLGLIEVGVVAMIVRSRSLETRLILIAALATNFLLYRVGMWWMGVGKPCSCFGNAAAWTHIAPSTLDHLAAAGLIWMLATSYVPLLLLIPRWRSPAGQAQSTERPAFPITA